MPPLGARERQLRLAADERREAVVRPGLRRTAAELGQPRRLGGDHAAAVGLVPEDLGLEPRPGWRGLLSASSPRASPRAGRCAGAAATRRAAGR